MSVRTYVSFRPQKVFSDLNSLVCR